MAESNSAEPPDSTGASSTPSDGERSEPAGTTTPAPEPEAPEPLPRLTADEVWKALAKATDAVLGHITPKGAPRTSGIVYRVVDRRLYIAVDRNSWKARQISTGDEVSVTALVRRGGIFSLFFPIPPATITFRGTATLYPAGSSEVRPILAKLEPLIPPNRTDTCCLIGIAPVGHFLTYGIGVPVLAMRDDPEKSSARVPVA
jgi:hypothetical protein